MKIHPNKLRSIHRKLELLYEEFSVEEHLCRDPVGALDRGLDPADLEILSFLIAGLSYGRVEQIYRSFENLQISLKALGCAANGAGVSGLLIETPTPELRKNSSKAFRGWKHRLNTSNDIVDLLQILSLALKENGSLSNLFTLASSRTFQESLELFSSSLSQLGNSSGIKSREKKGTGPWKGTGPQWFFASPQDGSTCKRMLMWMRWMLRKDEIDLGLWDLPQYRKQLLWPVDTHIQKWALTEGLTDRKSVSWKFCLELSAAAQRINPDDPIKYDFSICQAGMAAFRKR